MPRKKTHPFLHYMQYLLVRAFLSLLGVIPPRITFYLPPILGFLIYHILRKRTAIGRENLIHAFGKTIAPEERERILREVGTNLVRTLLEMLYSPRLLTSENWRDYVKVEGEEILREMLASEKGAVFCTGHLGNWEVLGLAGTQLGFSLHPLARPLDNPYLNNYLLKQREGAGLRIIDKKGALRIAAGVLHEGKALAFLIDQDARRRGIFVDFFGRKASTHPGFALLALREDAPVVPACLVREKGLFRFRLIADKAIRPDQNAPREKELMRITQEATTALEKMIRREPAQWLWIHKRWKTSPQDGGREERTSRKEGIATNGR